MKKTFIIIWIFFFIFYILGINHVNAINVTDVLDSAKSFEIAGQVEIIENDGNLQIDDGKLKQASDTVYNILLVIGIIAAVITGLIIAIKFILCSANEKAELKNTIIAYIIGCIIIFGAFGIWKIVVTSLNEASPKITEEEIRIAQEEKEEKNRIEEQKKKEQDKKENGSTTDSNNSNDNSDTNENSNNDSKNNTNSSKTDKVENEDNKNVTTLLNTIAGYAQQIEKDYRAGRYWEYSNNKRGLGEKRTYNSFKDALNGERTTNCARIVFWAFYDMGITNQKEDIYSNSSGELKAKESTKNRIKKYARIIRVNKTPNQLRSEGNLKPGDICLYTSHTNIYIGNGKWYDAGRGSGIGNAYSYKSVNGNAIYRFKRVGPCNSSYVNHKATYIIRLKDQT